VNSLQAWQSLCKTIGVPESREGEDLPQLTSISACQRVCSSLSSTFNVSLTTLHGRPSTASMLTSSIL
jgi:hypothetical protein